MSEVATASLNTFGKASPKADFVPPSEQLITLTIGQLQDLITQAVEKSTQGLKDEVSELKATVASQDEKIAVLEDTEAALKEHHVFSMVSKVEDLWAWVEELDRRTEVKPQPLQKDRGEILRALLAANGGKMLAKDARQKMRLSKELFSMLMASMDDYIEVKPLHSDKRKKVLVLK